MRIGELSKATGVDVANIRYYEQEGLMPKAARELNGFRRYTENHRRRLMLIRTLRGLEFPLDHIRQVTGYLDDPAKGCESVVNLVASHLAFVTERMDRMQAISSELADLYCQCVAPKCVDRCGIVRHLLDAVDRVRQLDPEYSGAHSTPMAGGLQMSSSNGNYGGNADIAVVVG
jgi:DNA-binding transcriptional MerR regulator